jgi:hypothetical protein
MTPLTPEELAERAAATPPDPRERLLALATACAEEFGLPEVAAHLRNPRLTDAIAWASDEWRSVEKELPPVGEWVMGKWPLRDTRGTDVAVTRRAARDYGDESEAWWSDSGDEMVGPPDWWRPLRLPPPPGEPATAECPRCHGERTVVIFDGPGATNPRHVDCPACRGTGRVSPAPAERRCERCGELATAVPGYAGVVCPCRGSGVAQPARST